jgi:hypothetical protein
MNEGDLDKIKQRAAINPELLAREDILLGASAINEMLTGVQKGYQTGRYNIENIHYANYVSITGQNINVAFEFWIEDTAEAVILKNAHRRAYEGWGTTAFTELEHIATALAILQKKPVKFIFPLYNQKDTKEFLTLRGYQPGSIIQHDEGPTQTLERTFQPIQKI